MLSISEASKFLGVSEDTLRRWERTGKIKSTRTTGGHRRYDKNDLIQMGTNRSKRDRLTIGYCRVSSPEQKEDLKKQIENVSNYCTANGYQFKIIQDIGSGISYNRDGLNELIEAICSNEAETIVLNYRDRLVRFGYEVIEKLCAIYNVKIEIINHTDDETYENEIVQDTLTIINTATTRLYGNRSRKKSAIIKKNKELFSKDNDFEYEILENSKEE